QRQVTLERVGGGSAGHDCAAAVVERQARNQAAHAGGLQRHLRVSELQTGVEHKVVLIAGGGDVRGGAGVDGAVGVHAQVELGRLGETAVAGGPFVGVRRPRVVQR